MSSSESVPMDESVPQRLRGDAQVPERDLRLLDDPDEWSGFSRPWAKDTRYWESNVLVQGMHCTACSLSVEDVLRETPGVVGVQVGAASGRARVVWSAQQTVPSRWMRSVESAGYCLVPANDAFSLERRTLETRAALWQWMVAGLCMMQVMMYAYPAYIAAPGDLTPEMEKLLRWASWVIALPVMLFASGGFFRNAWADLRHRRISMDLPVALGIGITFAVSTAGTFDMQGIFGREVFFDSLTMFVFFLLSGRWLELRLRDRTAGALEAVLNRLPDSIERQGPDGAFERVAVRRVRVGDVVRVQPGESFPADGQITWGHTQVDEALLTGESHPLERGEGDAVVAGSFNLSASVTVRVQRTGADTRYAQIVELMEQAATSRPARARLADRLAKPFLVFVLLAAVAAAGFWWGRDPGHAIMVAVAVLIVTCPCALSLATPAAMLASAGALARAGVLVRQLQALETLAQVDTVVFDKTGTLTESAMGLEAVRCRAGLAQSDALALAAALAIHSLHPVSRALVAAARQGGAQGYRCDGAQELAGQGVLATSVHGDAAHWLPRGDLRLGSAAFCRLTDLASAQGRVHLSDDDGWIASFALAEQMRDDALQTVRGLAAQGVDVHLYSGDSDVVVQAMASKLQVAHARGELTPDGKLALVRTMQGTGRVVAMVGDGVNDGPVLAGANVSIALSHGAPLLQSRSDFVVVGDSLLPVLQVLVLARKTRRIVGQNLLWALVYNAACIPLAVLGYLPAWAAGLGMASSSLLVVLNALRLSRLPQLARSQ
ncbi:cation-translocating P-type ATPase [Curvibacter sp. APW13]|uniref:heavy metal translocating P-type ATPase n=1 Tax=Curvibacter sp. APW13 TaxID=3077236 RepID=UPI0028DED3B1|nr:cation-translocating P-type ATPase [Curvibacter sp. APW13]MDT8992257.1 cation-translocating P-type ATPase [Curvibacter sp. APW13]